jgi:uncharacterized membrane protein YgaE (UPF0421/DUF939 family)
LISILKKKNYYYSYMPFRSRIDTNNFQSLFHALSLSNNDSKLTATHVKEIKHNLNPINYV